MPNRIGARLLATIPLLALASLALAPPAQAVPASSAQYLYSTPRDSTKDECGAHNLDRCPLGNDLLHRIRAVKKGGRIDVVLYSSSRGDLVDALLSAADRGVRVRLLTSHAKPDGEDDGVALWGQVERLVNGLKARHQSVKVGWGSLSRSGTAGIEHRKLVLIDPDGRLNGNETTISDSGNWTYSLDTAFNDRLVVRDRCMYAGVVKHLDVLAKDAKISTKTGAVVKTCDGKRALYFMPESKVDPVLEWARKAKCGKGDRVDFANFYFTGSKSALMDQLIRFRRAGADVQVAANDAKWSDVQRKRLVKAGVTVWDVNGVHIYDHRKMLDATGCGSPFGAQGSTTMNATAYEKNGNAVLTTKVASDVSAMRAGFNAMVKGKHRVTTGDLK